ncbi:MAG: glycosyltransferase [FCB group bacterium]|nr:glycosyltransferase [FCB group bacterium]
MTIPDISLIIVSYNVKTFLQHCLCSVQKAAEKMNVEIFVVDNHSIDGTPGMVQSEFPSVHFIGNEKNLGFGKANNQALKLSKGKYVLFLNPDTLVEENTLHVCFDFMEKNPEIGICGPKILNSDGSLQLACRRSFPSPSVALPKLLGLSRLFPKSRLFAKYNLTYKDPDQSYPVDAISGSFMFCRGDLICQLGGFDEDFFMYGEDLDLCRRVQIAGKQVFYLADTTILHYKGESAKSAPFDSMMAFYKAMDIFLHKHFSPFYSFITTLFFRMGIVFHLIARFCGKAFFAVRLLLLDVMLIALALAISMFLRFAHTGLIPAFHQFMPVMAGYTFVYLIFQVLGGSYRRDKQYDFVRAAANLFPGFILNGFFTFFFMPQALSRFVFIVSFLMMLVILPGWRIVASRIRSRHFRQDAESARRTLVIGSGKEGQRIAATLGLHPELGYLFVGFADTDLSHPKTIGSTGDLSLLIRTRGIDNVIFSSDVFSLGEIIAMIAELAHFPVSIKIIPEKENMLFGKAVIENLDDIPVIEMEYTILKPEWRIAKRLLDIVFAVSMLVLLGPFALCVRLFTRAHPVRFSEDIEHGRILQRKDGSEPWLYWYPMLFSLLRGEMTVVGDLKNIPEGSKRYYKPGMTSIMRSEKPALPSPDEHERFIHYYMSNFSFVLDAEIIFKTLLLKKN